MSGNDEKYGNVSDLLNGGKGEATETPQPRQRRPRSTPPALEAMQGKNKHSEALEAREQEFLSLKEQVAQLKGTEQKALMLPFSKRKIFFKKVSLKPSSTTIHPSNRRIQELLSPEDPNIQHLLESIKNEEQRDPVLARILSDDTIEVIDGSRRRFVGTELEKLNPEFTIDAWVSADVPDEDAEYLTKVENELGEKITPWETAQWYKKLSDGGLTLDEIGIKEGVAKSTVSETIKLAVIPVQLVELLESPSALSIRASKSILKLTETLKDSSLSKLVEELTSDVKYADASSLSLAIKLTLTPKKEPKKMGANAKTVIKCKGGLSATINRHRTNEGQYKIDLKGLSSDSLAKVEAFFKNL